MLWPSNFNGLVARISITGKKISIEFEMHENTQTKNSKLNGLELLWKGYYMI